MRNRVKEYDKILIDLVASIFSVIIKPSKPDQFIFADIDPGLLFHFPDGAKVLISAVIFVFCKPKIPTFAK